MSERPILFNDEMVRAILDGRKTQTRRIVKPQPDAPSDVRWVLRDGLWHPCVDTLCRGVLDPIGPGIRCPFGQPGDLLWAREAWGLYREAWVLYFYSDVKEWYRFSVAGADDRILDHWAVAHRATWGPQQEGCFWRPSIHMPRWAARIWLRVTGVRVERVQDITEEDAIAEGVEPWVSTDYAESYRYGFSDVWSSIYGDESWKRNDWVWVCEFERAEAPR